MRQLEIFDPAREEAEKERGMKQAAESPGHREVLSLARRLAVGIAVTGDGTCHADQVQAALRTLGFKSSDLGNAAGSIFRGGKWRWTGRRVHSTRRGSHSNEIRVWQLVEG